jgi:hypothetical protein
MRGHEVRSYMVSNEKSSVRGLLSMHDEKVDSVLKVPDLR